MGCSPGPGEAADPFSSLSEAATSPSGRPKVAYLSPSNAQANGSSPVEAHVRRRASEELEAAERLAEVRASGVSGKTGMHASDVHALRAERHKQRMKTYDFARAGNWRDEERRRLSAVDTGEEPVGQVPCANCVSWSGIWLRVATW